MLFILIQFFVLAYCGTGQSVQDCTAVLAAACLTVSSSLCPICVTQAWRSLRSGSCLQSTLGQSIVERCHPYQTQIPTAEKLKAPWSPADLAHTNVAGFLRYLPVVAEPDPCGGTGRVTLVGHRAGGHRFALHTKLTSRAETYNVALWAPEGTLDAYIGMLEDDRRDMLRLSWDCGLPQMCYSVGFHIPDSHVVVELISNQTSSTRWQHIGKARHSFATGESPGAPYMSPLHDSRDVSNLDEVILYYSSVLGITPLRQETKASGTKVAAFSLPTLDTFRHNVTLQYVERAEANPWTISPTSCWPIHGANGFTPLDA